MVNNYEIQVKSSFNCMKGITTIKEDIVNISFETRLSRHCEER